MTIFRYLVILAFGMFALSTFMLIAVYKYPKCVERVYNWMGAVPNRKLWVCTAIVIALAVFPFVFPYLILAALLIYAFYTPPAPPLRTENYIDAVYEAMFLVLNNCAAQIAVQAPTSSNELWCDPPLTEKDRIKAVQINVIKTSGEKFPLEACNRAKEIIQIKTDTLYKDGDIMDIPWLNNAFPPIVIDHIVDDGNNFIVIHVVLPLNDPATHAYLKKRLWRRGIKTKTGATPVDKEL